jgi:hypothetical protein
MMVWVPRRARTKETYPGKLDSVRGRDEFSPWRLCSTGTNAETVGGGLTAGHTPLECVIKECGEEANLADDFVRARVKYVADIAASAPSVNGIIERADS